MSCAKEFIKGIIGKEKLMTKAKAKAKDASAKDNVQYKDKIYVNYNLNAYCQHCNMEFPKPKTVCPVCKNQLRQHSKVWDGER